MILSNEKEFFHDDKGRLMWRIQSENSVVMSTPFKVVDVKEVGDVWVLDIEFQDIGGKMKQTTISRYELSGTTNALSRLYSQGMPHPDDTTALLYYLRTRTPADLEEKENE